jgi:dynein heavy chain
MYLHTTAMPHEVPPEMAAHVGLLYFDQTREDVEEQLLDRFMRREKIRLDEEKRSLLKERMANLKYLEELEREMVQCLSSEVRLLHDLASTKKLAELKKQHEETEERYCIILLRGFILVREFDSFDTPSANVEWKLQSRP